VQRFVKVNSSSEAPLQAQPRYPTPAFVPGYQACATHVSQQESLVLPSRVALLPDDPVGEAPELVSAG
jgi:hypothetical protein